MTGTGNGAARILVVDDDPRIAAALRRALTYEGYRVEVAADGPAALLSARERPPDLVVLDVMLPGLDGVEVCRRLRAGGEVAILMLTARDATGDRVRGLDSGADDYLTKPFATEELLARVRALLRRLGSRQPADAFLRYEGIALDPAAREVRRGQRPIALTALEFDLLLCFLRHPRQVLTREQLLDAVWGSDVAITSNAVDVYVGYLRGKLEADGEPRLIQTVRGVGYVLRTSPEGERSAAR
jgi:two-component system, OmpR family, response regulator MprA